MIEVMRTTVVGPSDPAELVCSEITKFLRATTSEWDLPVFGLSIICGTSTKSSTSPSHTSRPAEPST
jgi:hypothetical protein